MKRPKQPQKKIVAPGAPGSEIGSLAKIKKALMGEALLELLKERGLTRWGFARDIGVKYHTTYFWAKGVTPPSDKNAMKAALYLGLVDPGGDKMIRLIRERANIDRKIKAIDGKK
jgi:hypothetical protein